MEVLHLARGAAGATASAASSAADVASRALDALSPWARAGAAAARAPATASRGASRRAGSTKAGDETEPQSLRQRAASGASFAIAVAAGAALGAGAVAAARLLRRSLLEATLCAVCEALEQEAASDALDFFVDLGVLRALLRHGHLHAGPHADEAVHFASGVVVVRTDAPTASPTNASAAAAEAASAAGADAFIHELRERLQRRLGPRFKVELAATSAEAPGGPYRWLRVRPRGVPAALVALDVYLGERVPPHGHVSSKAAKQQAQPAGLIALFSAASHAPASAALPSRRVAGAGALACPACAARGEMHALRAPADAEAMLRARFGAAWRGGAHALRAEPARSGAPIMAVGGALGKLARALGAPV